MSQLWVQQASRLLDAALPFPEKARKEAPPRLVKSPRPSHFTEVAVQLLLSQRHSWDVDRARSRERLQTGMQQNILGTRTWNNTPCFLIKRFFLYAYPFHFHSALGPASPQLHGLVTLRGSFR